MLLRGNNSSALFVAVRLGLLKVLMKKCVEGQTFLSVMADLRRQLLKEKGASLLRHVGLEKNTGEGEENFKAEPWSDYFDEQMVIDGGFQVYKAGKTGPICLFIHGAGHTSLSWALVAVINFILF